MPVPPQISVDYPSFAFTLDVESWEISAIFSITVSYEAFGAHLLAHAPVGGCYIDAMSRATDCLH
jgi:hypothetical protein